MREGSIKTRNGDLGPYVLSTFAATVRYLGFMSGSSQRILSTCECYPAVVQIVEMGYFPCAPIRPTLAFDINLLEFVTIASHHMAPNVTGWSHTLQYFLSIRGYLFGENVRAFFTGVSYGTEESFRTRFGGVSEMHYIGTKLSLRWQTRKSVHGSGIRPPP